MGDALNTLADSLSALDAEDIVNNSSVPGTNISEALDALKSMTGVSSVFGRTGTVTAQVGDYASSQIVNNSSVPGATVSDALESISNAGVMSFAGRTGAVLPVSGDYTSATVPNTSNVAGATLRIGPSGVTVQVYAIGT